MQMVMSPIIAMHIPCPTCQQWPHHPGCPYDELMSALQNHRRIDCPVCNECEVLGNSSDYWECRSCHTQFCSSGISDTLNPKETLLVVNPDAPFSEGVRRVYIFEKKGEGKFPHDQLVKNLKKLNTSFKRKMRRKRN